jgi:hypothetical protein
LTTQENNAMSLSTKVPLGLAAGIVTGIFFGDMAAPLSVVGRQQFAVAVPQPNPDSVPAGYPMPYGEEGRREFVDALVNLKISDGTAAELFAHWLEGRGAARQHRRWSIIRDVLGWAN